MADVQMTMVVDTSGLERAIPQICAFGRRTVQQQCVTSAGYIVKDAMDNTLAIFPDSIDARLGIKVISYTNAKKTRISKAKRRTSFKNSVAVGKAVPLGVLVVMARFNPGSRYNQLTGGKWALSHALPSGKGSLMARRQMMSDLITRMISARRSSSALLKSGWIKPLQIINASPFFVRKRGSGLGAEARIAEKSFDIDRLGDATIAVNGDSILVTAMNLTTGGSNQALAERHMKYAMLQALPPLQAAIAKEETGIYALIEARLAAGMKQNFIDI